jgi:hypothetical protein
MGMFLFARVVAELGLEPVVVVYGVRIWTAYDCIPLCETRRRLWMELHVGPSPFAELITVLCSKLLCYAVGSRACTWNCVWVYLPLQGYSQIFK